MTDGEYQKIKKMICKFEQMEDTQGGVLEVRRVEHTGVIIKLNMYQKKERARHLQ
jgi:hypothetical protein